MVDDEIKLRPVNRRLNEVTGRLVFPHACPTLFVIPRHQALVDTEIDNTRLRCFFVEGVHQFLIIQPEGVLRLSRQRVTDGVKLPACWRTLGQGAVHFFHPARLSRGHNVVGQHAGVTGRRVDHLGRFSDLCVIEEFPRIVVKRRTTQHRYIGIAIEIDLPHVILELQQVDVDAGGVHPRLPIRRGLLQEPKETFLRVIVAHEVGLHVKNKLLPQRFSALVGHRGVGGFRLRHVEHVSVNTVHGQESGRHARTGLEELAAIHTLLGAVGVGQFLDARLDLLLLRILRRRVEFAVGDDLRGNRRVERVFRSFDKREFAITEIGAHFFLPNC